MASLIAFNPAADSFRVFGFAGWACCRFSAAHLALCAAAILARLADRAALRWTRVIRSGCRGLRTVLTDLRLDIGYLGRDVFDFALIPITANKGLKMNELTVVDKTSEWRRMKSPLAVCRRLSGHRVHGVSYPHPHRRHNSTGILADNHSAGGAARNTPYGSPHNLPCNSSHSKWCKPARPES